MKKKLGLTIGALIAAAVLGLGFFQIGAVQAEPDLTSDDIRKKVIAQYPGKINELELENDSKKAIYRVKISIEDKEYELKLDGNTGEVLSLYEKVISQKENKDDKVINSSTFTKKVLTTDDADVKHVEKLNKQEGNTQKQEKRNEKSTKEPESNNKLVITEKASVNNTDDKTVKADKPSVKRGKQAIISKSKAKSIALNQFSGDIQGMELDEDNDHLIYEVEIENGDNEAEIEIDAYTGEVIMVDIDIDDD